MTSETKTNHTPGPWIWGPNARRYADPNLSECQRVMNVRLGKTTALCWDDRDARLIAAAPDLLDILLDLRRAWLAGRVADVEGILTGDVLADAVDRATG